VGKRLQDEHVRTAAASEEAAAERAKAARLMAALDKCQSASGLEVGAHREQMKAHAMMAHAEVKLLNPITSCVSRTIWR
jgi:hypothetical protein